MAEADETWGYAVHLYATGFCYDIAEVELEPTGRMDRRETFYSGESIRVRVDPVTGAGTIVEE